MCVVNSYRGGVPRLDSHWQLSGRPGCFVTYGPYSYIQKWVGLCDMNFEVCIAISLLMDYGLIR